MKNIQIHEVIKKSDLKEFIYLPARLHKNHKNWVPPFYSDEWAYFNRKKNRAFSYCDTVIALATLDGKIVGRIMGIINQRYNEEKNERTARFSFFESVNDREVSEKLLTYVEDWALNKGMVKIIGPFGMYYHDPIGFMTEGYNEKPSTTANYNFEYMIPLMESANYKCETDLVVYKLDIPESFPEVYLRIHNKIIQNGLLRMVRFSTKREIRKYIHPVLSLMNESFKEIYGYSQIDNYEMKVLANHFIPLIDPKFVAVVKAGDEIAGFTISIPNINEGLIAAAGHLFPFGIFKIIKAFKKSKQLDLLIGGIKEKYRGMGIDVLTAIHIINVAKMTGFQTIDSHLELESNWRIRAEMEKLGGKVCKKYRIYSKKLVGFT